MENVSVLGKNVKIMRTEKGLSVNALAKLAGIGVATISQIENGHRQNLKGDTIIKLAGALNCTAQDLLTDEDHLEVETNDVCQILSMLCHSGLAELDAELMDKDEMILLETGITMVINAIRMRRHNIMMAKLNGENVNKTLRVIK